MDSDHKFTDMVKEFQISSLSCLTVSARAHCMNYQQQQKPDAYDEIMAAEQLIQSSTICYLFFKIINTLQSPGWTHTNSTTSATSDAINVCANKIEP